MFTIFQVTVVLFLTSPLSHRSSAYELQDTIHTLKEENLHLQHQLENLTLALRDLKHLLTKYSKVSGEELNPEFLHAWYAWAQHDISAETRHMLEQTLCLTGLHGAAQPIFITTGILFLPALISLILLHLM